WQTMQVASTPELQVENARARKELIRVDGKLLEAWRLEVTGTEARDPNSDPDMAAPFYMHEYMVSDGGKMLRNTDLVKNDAFVYRVYAEQTGVRRPLDGPLEGFSPHPTGTPDGSKARSE